MRDDFSELERQVSGYFAEKLPGSSVQIAIVNDYDTFYMNQFLVRAVGPTGIPEQRRIAGGNRQLQSHLDEIIAEITPPKKAEPIPLKPPRYGAARRFVKQGRSAHSLA